MSRLARRLPVLYDHEVTTADTSAAAHAAQIAAIRRLSPEARVRIAAEMSQAAREISLEGIRRRNPALTDDEARFELARLLYGDDLARRAYRRMR